MGFTPTNLLGPELQSAITSIFTQVMNALASYEFTIVSVGVTVFIALIGVFLFIKAMKKIADVGASKVGL